MHLIKANNGIKIRYLTHDEKEAVRMKWQHMELDTESVIVINELLNEMRKQDYFLVCDCKDKNPPKLTTVSRNNKISLRNCPDSIAHEKGCVMERVHGITENGVDSGTVRKSPLKKVNYHKIIPTVDDGGKTARPVTPGTPEGSGLTKTRRSALAGILLSLIEDAQLNRIELSRNTPLLNMTIKEAIDKLQGVTKNNQYKKSRYLNDIVHFSPWMSDTKKESVMANLEAMAWGKNEVPSFWIIFECGDVDESEAIFKKWDNEYPHRPTKGMRINGEYGQGCRENYWVIVRYVRDNETKKVTCRDGYAHAMYSGSCPVPVDSNLEKQTLIDLAKATKWVKDNVCAVNVVMEKPLFDKEIEYEGERGYVLPDFILTIESDINGVQTRHRLVVETTGIYTDEYIKRKTTQHEGMAQLGNVITDPPSWPKSKSREYFVKLAGKFIIPEPHRRDS